MAKGTLALRQIQLGDNADTSKNFVISVPAVADGTLVIERGNGTDVITVAATGNVTQKAGIFTDGVSGTLLATADATYGSKLWNIGGSGLSLGTNNENAINISATQVATFVNMPQHGTAKIIDSGGSGVTRWVKFSDGTYEFSTQVTVVNAAANTNAAVDTVYPGGFSISNAVITATVASSNASPTGGMVYAVAGSATTFRITATMNTICTNIYNVLGMGRWK